MKITPARWYRDPPGGVVRFSTMKIKPWPWVSFFVHHHAFFWTIVVESKVRAACEGP